MVPNSSCTLELLGVGGLKNSYTQVHSQTNWFRLSGGGTPALDFFFESFSGYSEGQPELRTTVLDGQPFISSFI